MKTDKGELFLKRKHSCLMQIKVIFCNAVSLKARSDGRPDGFIRQTEI